MKTVTRRLMSLLLCLLMLFTNMSFVSADNEWDAECVLGKQSMFKNISVYGEVSGRLLPEVEKGGREAWEIQPASWYNNSAFVDVKNGISAGSGKNIYVEVDYYDETDVGWFRIEYNSRNNPGVMSERLYTKGSSEWKTAGFVLYAPTFMNDLNEADFAVTTNSDNYPSIVNIAIGGIRVKQLDEVSPLDIRIDFNRQIKNFYSDEDLSFDIVLSNQLASSYDMDFTYEIVNSYGETVAQWTEKTTVPSLGNIKINQKRPEFNVYGRHILRVKGRNEEFNYSVYTESEFSYIKISRFRNDRFGVCNHLSWGQVARDPEVIYSMMKKAGIGWTRDEILWKDFEQALGVFQLQPYHERMIDLALENDVEPLIVLNGGNTLYSSGGGESLTPWDNAYPTTPEGYKVFEEYCYQLVKALEGRVSNFEYWNEYGWGGYNIDKYADFAKCMWSGVKRANPDANTVGICAAGTGLDMIKISWDMGAAKYMDDISYHKYANFSPDTANVETNSRSVRELVDSYEDGKGKKIWITEMGYTTHENSHNRSGENLLKEFAIHMEDGLIERMFWYDFTNDGTTYDTREAHFGMTENFGISNPNRFLAKQSYITAAHMNDVMGTPDFQKKLRLNDERVYAYHFKRQQDGKDIAILWCTGENDVVTLKLGDENINVTDTFGNPIEITGNNGQYTFVLGTRPILVEGDFLSFEEGTPEIYFSETNVISPYIDTASVYIYKTTDENVNIEIGEIFENSKVEVLNKPKFNGKIAEIKLSMNGDANKKIEKPIEITTLSGIAYYGGKYDVPTEIPIKLVTESGKVLYDNSIRVEYSEGVDVSGRTRLYNDKNTSRWMLELDVESNFHTKDLTAKVEITEPLVFAKTYNAGVIKSGETSKLRFHLPEIESFTSYKMKGKLLLSNGYAHEFEIPIDFALAKKTDNVPVIDGVVSDNEWKKETVIISNREDQVELILDQPWRGVTDLSAKSYLQWDDDYLYLASVVTDDMHDNEHSGAAIWQGDSLQFAILLHRTKVNGERVGSFTEYGVALGKNGEQVIHKYSVEDGGSYNIEKSRAVVKRIGNTTNYEMKLAWEEILPAGEKPEENLEISFSMIVNDADKNGRKGWIGFGSGIGKTKEATELARIRLVPKQ